MLSCGVITIYPLYIRSKDLILDLGSKFVANVYFRVSFPSPPQVIIVSTVPLLTFLCMVVMVNSMCHLGWAREAVLSS